MDRNESQPSISILEVPMKRLSIINSMAVVMMLIISLMSTAAMAGPQKAEKPMTDDDKSAIVDTITKAFIDNYIFLEDAQKMEQLLKKKLKKGKYDDIDSRMEFAQVLTQDLRSINGDRHITIDALEPDTMIVIDPSETDDEEKKQKALKSMQKRNFMFKKIEILEGNIGYLRFDMFADASVAGPTAIAAMNFLAHCDAIIFDMRYNGGGNPSMIQLLTSYLVEEPTHLNSFYIRKTDETNQFWTQASVPGPCLAHVDAYVLTSNYTFSGAEEFTYNLKNLKRASIIGETTGGGAHPVDSHPFPELGMLAIIPFGRAINPISGTNWEGTGVEPDIKVPADDALLTARKVALEKLMEKAEDQRDKQALDWAVLTIESQLNPAELTLEQMKLYAGNYTDRELKVSEDGKLLYHRIDRPWNELIPLTDTIFRMDGVDYFRLEVVLDESGKPVKLVGHYNNGHRDESPRNE